MALTTFEEDLKEQLLHSMGFPIVQVEMKDLDDNWESVFKNAKRWLRKYHAQKKVKAITGFKTSGIPLAEIDPDIKTVNRVIFENASHYKIMGIGQFYDNVPLGGGLITGYVDYNTWVQYLQELETAKRAFSANPDWFIEAGELKFNQGARHTQMIVIEYTLKGIDSASVCTPWDDYYFRILKAGIKEQIGRYRSKFGSYSTPGGDANLDGETLINESKEDITELRDEIIEDRQGSTIFLM